MAKRVTIRGLDKLQGKFKRLGKLAQAQTLAAATVAGSAPILNAAIDKVPVFTHTLQRSLHTKVIEARADYAYAETGTDVAYAARQEFGYTGPDSLGRTFHQVAHPYMRPAFDEHQAEAVQEIHDSLKAALDNLV